MFIGTLCISCSACIYLYVFLVMHYLELYDTSLIEINMIIYNSPSLPLRDVLRHFFRGAYIGFSLRVGEGPQHLLGSEINQKIVDFTYLWGLAQYPPPTCSRLC